MSTEVIRKNNDNVVKTDKKARPPKKRRSFSLEKRRSIAGYMFVFPWIIGFIAFMAYPLVMSLIYSFSNVVVSGKVTLEYVGMNNYIHIFTRDTEFLPKFGQTIRITVVYTPFIVVFALFVAILLNRKLKFRGGFRLIFFLPVLLGTGLVYQKLSNVTSMLSMPETLTESLYYMFGADVSTTITQIIEEVLRVFWKTGVQIIIFLAGLQGIPDSLYEAAKVDNANAWDMLWKVTIPILSPVILLNTIYTIIDSFRDASNPLVEYIIKQIKQYSEFDIGTAMGWMYFIVTFIIIGFVFLFMRRSVYYEK